MATKADLIREALRQFPDLTPTNLANKIMEQNQGVTVRPQEVSTMKSKLKAAATAPQEMPRPTPQEEITTEAGLAERLNRLREAADAVGGVEEAKRILDMLK